jgi:glycosyltransferase involved in cell wall biosynthesis
MKALFIANDPSIFDSESPARARMQVYAAHIGTLHVLSYAKPEHHHVYAGGLQEGGLILTSVGGGKIGRFLALQKKARDLIGSEGIEIVSAQDPFEYGWIAMQAVQGTEAKLHLQVHTDFCSPWFTRSGVMRARSVPMPLLNTVRRAIADRVLPKADGIRAVSERVKASLVARYGSRIPEPFVIPIATSVELPAPVPLPPHPFSFALITVGRLEPEKRIDDILDAIARLALTYPMLGLVVVGDGRERVRLMRRAQRLGLADRVLFLGWRTDALALMRSAQAYIHTSAYEGYGLVLIEAALARLPIITTDVGIVGEVLTGYEDALVAPVADPAALAVHIAGLIEDVQTRTALAMSAERKVQAHLAGLQDQPAQIAADLARTIAT